MNSDRIQSSRSGLAGFSLVEVMAVIGVMGFIAASLAGAFNHLASRQQAKDAAVQFQAIVREASSLARREKAPVRITFILPEAAAALKSAGVKTEGNQPLPGCRILVFRVPSRNLPQTALLASGGTGLEELMPVARMPRFPSLVGDWAASPERPHWVRWDKKVRLDGELADAFKNNGVTRDFQYQPDRTWGTRRDVATNEDPFSVYPGHFSLSPYQVMRVLKTGPLPDSGSLEIGGGRSVSVEDVWADQKLPHWEWLEGSPSAPGADRVALPSLDFLPDGGLANREKDELEFRFSNDGSTTEQWIVKLRTHDAETWIE